MRKFPLYDPDLSTATHTWSVRPVLIFLNKPEKNQNYLFTEVVIQEVLTRVRQWPPERHFKKPPGLRQVISSGFKWGNMRSIIFTIQWQRNLQEI